MKNQRFITRDECHQCQNPMAKGLHTCDLRYRNAATRREEFTITEEDFIEAPPAPIHYADLNMNPGGWGMSATSSGFTFPPLAVASLQNGVFTMDPGFRIFHNTCEEWNAGMFTDIPPTKR
jgi:hypothetical protein